MGQNQSSRKRSNSTTIPSSVYSPPNLNRTRSKSLLVPSTSSDNENNKFTADSTVNFNEKIQFDNIPSIKIDGEDSSNSSSSATNQTSVNNINSILSDKLFKQLQNILNDSSIDEIDFSYKNIKFELNFNDNEKIELLKSSSFDNIVKFDLGQNQLANLPTWMYSNNFNKLEILNLYQNQVAEIEFPCILPRLEKLILSQNELTAQSFINDSLNKQTSLKILILSSNNFNQFPKLNQLYQLEKLSLDRNKLENSSGDEQQQVLLLPDNIKFLSLSYNLFTSFPNVLLKSNSCQTIRELDLSHNQIQSIPSEICKLLSLQSLNLGFNKIESIPVELSECYQLVSLDLQSNSLTTITENSFSKLNNLNTLNLSNNKLTTLSKDIVNLASISILYVDNNCIESIAIPSNHSSLNELYINSNQLKSLESLCQLSFSNITKLAANFNQITTIPSMISNLKRLCKLELNENNITTVSPSIVSLKSLYEVGLGNNKIENLPPEMAQMTWLLDINLNKNPIQKNNVASKHGGKAGIFGLNNGGGGNLRAIRGGGIRKID
ncbi:hypothetical protein CYY_003884 [Polysphondylium violaceum]|uniref:Leucine-rich repeat-containing protein n=1 Tax=Polysphondylium violaceum TaxID=133409 RepID=A0A8J4UZT3_9MYCE|nr:hypothetical protein CYY_003884 [Polysphondylium violaceum]